MRLDQLDIIRFILALYIVLGHAIGFNLFLKSAGLAVDYFFILSGFVISLSFFRRDVSFGIFAGKRFARLWPLTAVTTIAFILIAGIIPNTLYLFANLTLLQNSGILDKYPYNAASWSISSEFLIGVMILFPIMKYRAKSAAFALATISLILMLKQPHALEHMHIQPFGPFTLGLLRCAFGTSVGYLLAEAYLNFRSDNVKRPLTMAAFQFLLVAVMLFTFGQQLSNAAKAASLLLCASTIFFLGSFTTGFTNALSNKALTYLGTLSFGIYLWHTPILIAFQKMGLLSNSKSNFESLISGDLSSIFVLLVYLSSVLAVSAVSYRMFEVPSQKYLNSLFTRPPVRDGPHSTESSQVGADVSDISTLPVRALSRSQG